jgi:hypothetical protein
MESTPTYPDLDWDSCGRHHVLFSGVADLSTLQSLLDTPPPGALTVIHLWPDVGTPQDLVPPVLPADARYVRAADAASALSQLDQVLQAARMGTRLYLAGSEELIWRASRLAADLGLGEDEVRRWRCGALSRPVFCVHCRAALPDVQTNVVCCSGCARMLFVRDHFSRRLGAYMGFQVDAETPGELPQVQHLCA